MGIKQGSSGPICAQCSAYSSALLSEHFWLCARIFVYTIQTRYPHSFSWLVMNDKGDQEIKSDTIGRVERKGSSVPSDRRWLLTKSIYQGLMSRDSSHIPLKYPKIKYAKSRSITVNHYSYYSSITHYLVTDSLPTGIAIPLHLRAGFRIVLRRQE